MPGCIFGVRSTKLLARPPCSIHSQSSFGSLPTALTLASVAWVACSCSDVPRRSRPSMVLLLHGILRASELMVFHLNDLSLILLVDSLQMLLNLLVFELHLLAMQIFN